MHELEHTKDCKFRIKNDIQHVGCQCNCHKIVTMN